MSRSVRFLDKLATRVPALPFSSPPSWSAGPAFTLCTLLALLLVLASFPAGMLAQEGEEGGFGRPGQALIRVIHTSPDAPALDLYAGDRIVASGLVQGDVTGFLPVLAGQMALLFVPTGGSTDTAIVETRFDLVDGGVYEVVALGQLREIDGRIYEIDRTRFADSDKARIRFLHFSPDAAEVDVFLGEEELLFDGADFADATGYVEILPGHHTINLRASDPALASSAGPMATVSLDVKIGGVYDILAVGLTASATFGLLPLGATSDLPCGVVLGGGGPGDACVRVVHASIDTPAFDLYVDDSDAPTIEGLSFASGSAFVAIPAGEHEIRLMTTGSPVDDPVREAKIDLEAGTAYDLAALDLREQLDVRALELDLSPLGAGQARLRFVHAMPNQSGLTLTLASGEPVYANLEFPDMSPSLEIPAEPLEISVLPAGEDVSVLWTERGIDPIPGQVTTLYVIGTGDGRVATVLMLTTPAVAASWKTLS